MVRLIDADAIYKILESCEIKKDTYGSLLNDWDHGYNCGIERAESEIECAPTVDAIPIEFIEEQIKEAEKVEEWELNHLWQIDNMYSSAYQNLLKAWAERKEE